MALSGISKFNWEKFLGKINSVDMKRKVNVLRNKANEISAMSSKYIKEPEAIDFAAYKGKLRFTSSAVESLEAAYKGKELPIYTATLPAFEAKRRAMMASVAKSVVDLAKQDLEQLQGQLDDFEKIRISKDTSMKELSDRFPQFAKEVEQEIKNHEWAK
ncbi:hypothetical protein B484DRAFT_446412 [Ochromonadaceae sp. CCMP2298]|nr:hypothetical protein B484DRAFT_446412 [Ochromonadaceae sp. CCMP2298]|mmetsp:Transcript_5514/g.12154  ORF Transcript_5514/g.12154 Transcript_5514/m.12154 type:complete len:159 (-) Transcript_5514:70-546(-)|eukprot:CAMPEP_0173178204 /NCGR_PEP_ID=MMETSP1141-20130122/5403_1 /TAXON_ID=483371 /ORGANISM="non described non described, Strain CCMP2298" /LENGTH=158 /DNA_ID=CAMNT_0014100663 /DNA_START=85 /DNA_END=561 /DNA_ORIENTATION=+